MFQGFQFNNGCTNLERKLFNDTLYTPYTTLFTLYLIGHKHKIRTIYRLRNFIAWGWGQEHKDSEVGVLELDYEPPEIRELFVVNVATLPFFSKLGFQ